MEAGAAGLEPVDRLVAGEDVAPELLAELSSLAHPPRVVAVFRRDDLPRGTRPVTLALWRVADPGNVGTLIRAADAFGAGIALSAGCADPTGSKALRGSMGSIFRVPLAGFEEGAGRRVALVPRGGTGLPELRPERRDRARARRGAGRAAAGRGRALRRARLDSTAGRWRVPERRARRCDRPLRAGTSGPHLKKRPAPLRGPVQRIRRVGFASVHLAQPAFRLRIAPLPSDRSVKASTFSVPCSAQERNYGIAVTGSRPLVNDFVAICADHVETRSRRCPRRP